ncbi:putative nuclease HARBI1 [Prorops nasuta]|uniref:putative nuclease HARBI1 n=1 Tax=Prorops nasuta TaxID=863751 RepID=UPI0034CF9003
MESEGITISNSSCFSSSDEDEQLRVAPTNIYLRDTNNPLEELSDRSFKLRYRFSKTFVKDFLLPIITDNLMENVNQRGLPVSALEKLLIALRFYGSNCFQNISGDLRGISQQSVSRIVKEISRCFAAQLPNFIFLPKTADECAHIKQKFHQIADFPNIIGAIDCTHILINNPGGNYGETFRNRKGLFSLNVQIIGGPDLQIQDIVVRHPGSAHDALIFHRSSVRARFEQNNELNGLLLGDSAYPAKKYLLTPVLNPTSDSEIKYNQSHIKTRNVVERLFGVIKRKFLFIVATAVLYNISVKYNENEIDDDETIEEDLSQDENLLSESEYEDDDEGEITEENGIVFRSQFIAKHFI